MSLDISLRGAIQHCDANRLDQMRKDAKPSAEFPARGSLSSVYPVLTAPKLVCCLAKPGAIVATDSAVLVQSRGFIQKNRELMYQFARDPLMSRLF